MNSADSSRRKHWEQVYADKLPNQVSWFQTEPVVSLGLIRQYSAGLKSALLDVGGGASHLIDHLLKSGYQNVHVLDISRNALQRSRERLGALADKVHWHVTDILEFRSDQEFGVWHDRAAFHFITDQEERATYIAKLASHLGEKGIAIIATFANDGPTRCSGLPIEQFNDEKINNTFAPDFELVESVPEIHSTPWGDLQSFRYFVLRKLSGDSISRRI